MIDQIPQVVLLIEYSRGYERALLQGIARYSRLHGPWHFCVNPENLERTLSSVDRSTGAGIIAKVETPRMARAILASGLPTILLDASHDKCLNGSASRMISSPRAISHAAAEHLLDVGLQHFAFVGEHRRKWSRERERGYVDYLQDLRYSPMTYHYQRSDPWIHSLATKRKLVKWLLALPKPVGIMACDDDYGFQVLEACQLADLAVPTEVAVVGVGNDDLLCELARPTLSSVALNAENGGYRAAALLAHLMLGTSNRLPEQVHLEPLYTVQRASTEAIAVNDREVAAALQAIRCQSLHSCHIDEIVAPLVNSRRSFEIRFREAMGRTPYQELCRVQFLRAQRLLLETEDSVHDVALTAGFCSAEHLNSVFQKKLKKSPARYRNEHRGN